MADQVAAAQTVLIVDDDLGFVCWLGELFTEPGCRPLPGLSCGEATAVTKQLGNSMAVAALCLASIRTRVGQTKMPRCM
jgi:hypothetical protein